MKKCLICLSSVSTTHGYPRPRGSGPSFPSSSSEGPSLNCPLLDGEIDHFYLTHKLLGVSDEVCGSLLQAHGNPSSWFSLCQDCGSRFLVEGKRLFNQIQHLTKLHDDVRKGALERMRIKMEIEVEEVDEAGVFPDEEEESMTLDMGDIKVVIIDPNTTEKEDDDGAMTSIRSYLLTSSVEESVGFYDDDGGHIDDNNDTWGHMPLAIPPRTSRRLASTNPSSKDDRFKSTTNGEKNHDQEEVSKPGTRPIGMSRKEWRKVYSANKNTIIHKRPKGMQLRIWQRLIALSKHSSSTQEKNDNDAAKKKLSGKKRLQRITRDRALALAAKLKVKSKVDALLAEENDDDSDDEDDDDDALQEEVASSKSKKRKKKKKKVNLRKCRQCKTGNDLDPGETMEDHVRSLHTSLDVLACQGCGQVMVKVKDYLEHVFTAEMKEASTPCVTLALPCSHATCAEKKKQGGGGGGGVIRATKEALAIHYKTAHYGWRGASDGKSYPCNICDKAFTSHRRRTEHVRRVHLAPLIKCDRPNCNAIVKGVEKMKRHVRDVHMVDERTLPAFKCPECGREFKNPKYLKRHQQLHGAETPYLCQECGKGYKVWDQLRTHMWSHDEELYKEKYGKYKQNAMKRKAEGGKVVRRKAKKLSQNDDTYEEGPTSSSAPLVEVVDTASGDSSAIVSA